MNHIKEFIKLSKINYRDVPYSDESEVERNLGHKNKWLRLGIQSLKDLAKEININVETSKNLSGSIDRGYVTAFFNYDNNFVYVSINDCSSSILYRTAEHNKDYSGGSNNTVGISESGFDQLKEFLIKETKISSY